MVTEEKLLSGTDLDPMYVVGMEGFWGLMIFAIILPIIQQVECTGALCHDGRLEDSIAAFREIGANPALMALIAINLLCVALFNLSGVMITKYTSAAQRSTIDSCRTLVIWFVFILMGKEKFIIGELFGFILLVSGTLVYNEIIEVPISFLNVNTKRNLAELEEKNK